MDGRISDPASGSTATARERWLASLLLRREGELLPRFTHFYQTIAALPRAWQRRLQCKLAVTVTGAALLLALAGGPALAQPHAPAATITVANGAVIIANDGVCSLPEALINTNATSSSQLKADCAAGNLSGQDIVSLPVSGEFVLTAVDNISDGPNGLPAITSRVTIEGNGSTIRRSDADDTPQFRILRVNASGSLTLRSATIHHGDVGTDFSWPPQDSDYDGGGILSDGTLMIENSAITGNGAGDNGGGIAAVDLTLTESTVSDNWVYSYSSTLSGGGLYILGHATIFGSTISGNWAGVSGRYWWLDGGSGGGLHSAGTVVIKNSSITDNTSCEGGGIYNVGTLTLENSNVSGNVAEFAQEEFYTYVAGVGGGLHNAQYGIASVINSTISANEANYGGGLFNRGQTTLSNSTVSGNRTVDDSWWDYEGYSYTVYGTGGGILTVGGYLDCGVTTLRGTIVSGNTAETSGPEAEVEGPGNNCTPTMTVNAFNVFGHSGNTGLTGFSPGASDIVPSVGLSVVLSPLADNGGPTQTHALPPGSPAIDLVPNATCSAAPVNGVDQRGEPRNFNGADGASNHECDAGSYEFQGQAFYVSAAASGAVGGVAFAPGDILRFNSSTGWSMFFDASDVGLTKNVTAFEIFDNGDILLSLTTGQTVAGVGTVMPQDVLRFIPTSTGPTTAGTFQMKLDGSAWRLTTSGEKIDALGLHADGRLAISTTGAAAVLKPNGDVLKAQDEDALGFNFDLLRWSALFDGTPIPGMGIEDINGLWINPATGDVYISIVGAFNLGGVAGNGKDIVRLTPSGAPGGYTPSLWWDGSAAGFPSTIDALEVQP